MAFKEYLPLPWDSETEKNKQNFIDNEVFKIKFEILIAFRH